MLSFGVGKVQTVSRVLFHRKRRTRFLSVYLQEFASVLTQNWGMVEETYIDTCKEEFRAIRQERELIHRYFYGTR